MALRESLRNGWVRLRRPAAPNRSCRTGGSRGVHVRHPASIRMAGALCAKAVLHLRADWAVGPAPLAALLPGDSDLVRDARTFGRRRLLAAHQARQIVRVVGAGVAGRLGCRGLPRLLSSGALSNSSDRSHGHCRSGDVLGTEAKLIRTGKAFEPTVVSILEPGSWRCAALVVPTAFVAAVLVHFVVLQRFPNSLNVLMQSLHRAQKLCD